MHHGQLGRSAVSRHDVRTLSFARYASAAPGYTAPPLAEDWSVAPLSYGWLGNDKIGCCTRSSIGHVAQQRAALLGLPSPVTTEDVLKAYGDGTGYDGTPATDRGDMIINALVQAKNVGIGTYRIRAFGRVDHNDSIQMRAALHLTGSLIIGADLPLSVWTQGVTWDVPPVGQRSPDDAPGSAGGHAFVIEGHERGWWIARPWIDKAKISYAWGELDISECWYTIDDYWVTRNHKAPNGFDLARLEHDVAAIAA